MNLTFLYNQSELDFLLFWLGNKLSISVDVEFKRAIKVLGNPNHPRRLSSFAKRFPITKEPKQTSCEKKRRSPFWNWKFFITLAADSIRWLARSHTHTQAHPAMREHEFKLRNAMASSLWCHEDTRDRVCVCVCARPLALFREQRVHTRNFPFPKQLKHQQKSKVEKKTGFECNVFVLPWVLPHPIDDPSSRLALFVVSLLGCLVMSGTVFLRSDATRQGERG